MFGATAPRRAISSFATPLATSNRPHMQIGDSQQPSRLPAVERTVGEEHEGPVLVFGANAGAYAGFVGSDVDRENVTEEVVVRELLQNALDAASGPPTHAEFRMLRLNVEDIPCIGDYRGAYDAALRNRSERTNSVTSANERQTTDRIERCLDPVTDVDVLVCVDSGQGIDEAALRSLYNTGDTSKRSGRGSVGLGHLTAFAASDLRYVLYVGRDASDCVTFGGHAILATHRSCSPGCSSMIQRDAHGYIRGAAEERESPASEATGHDTAPRSVMDWLPDAGSGSAVAILGYSPPSKRTVASDGPLGGLLRAAAKNFLVAVHLREVTVTASDAEGASVVIDTDTVGKILSATRDEKRRLAGQGVLGSAAWTAHTALTSGTRLDAGAGLPVGVTAWVLELEPWERTKVVFFRQGMWIADEVKHNRPADFSNKRPFFAVVNADHVGNDSLCALIRDSEGASHWQIRTGEITDNARRAMLVAALLKVADVLRGQAEELSREKVEPAALRLFTGEALSAAPAVPPPTADPAAIDAEVNLPDPAAADTPLGAHADGTLAPRGGPGGGDPAGKRAGAAAARAPRQGNRSGIRTACRHVSGREVHVAWQAEAFHIGDASLSVVSPSGADATCEQPETSRYLAIERAASISAAVEGIVGSEVRLCLPDLVGTATVYLSEEPHPQEAPYLTAEVTHRRHSVPHTC